jgi:hypothetical protein
MDRSLRPALPSVRDALVVLAGALVLVLACADRGGVMAPSLDDADASMRQGAMWRLASASARLEQLAHSAQGPDVHREEIIGLLDEMEAALESLEGQSGGDGDRMSEMLRQHGGSFRADVSAARADVLAEPPDYERAAAIRDACLRCHGAG